MKKYVIGLISVVMLMGTMAYPRKGGLYPYFQEDPTDPGKHYIKLATKGWLCGGVTLVPKKSELGWQLWVRAFRYQYDEKEGKTEMPVLLGEAELSQTKYPGGLRVKYDWGGILRKHYRILCVLRRGETEKKVDCKEFVDLVGIRHNKSCWIKASVAGGTGYKVKPGSLFEKLQEAVYPPLNMTVKKKK